MDAGLKKYLKTCKVFSTPGSFCFWIELPDNLLSQQLVNKAAELSILVESGDKLFASAHAPRNFIRLGFTAIAEEKIEAGLIKLGGLIETIAKPCKPHKNAS
jgi:GntR family transcriptional regulator/MocR family aminotransferase